MTAKVKAMDGDYIPLVSFSCTVKIYLAEERRLSSEHSCRFSLETLNSEPYLRVEGPGIRPKRIKLSADNIQTVAGKRINEGRLTIVFRELEWDQVTLSKVGNEHDLRGCYNILENISMGKFHSHAMVGTRGVISTPPSSARQPSQPTSGSTKRKLQLGSSRGSRMVAAATGNRSASNTSGFYHSSGTPVAAPFLPSSLPRTTCTSARRNLAIDLENQQGHKDANDFQPSPNYKQLTQQRLPLTDLSKQKGSALRALLVDNGEDAEGFANLGNTCYMNAVLQSLLGLDPFAEDLLNHKLVKSVHPGSLYRMMFLLLKSKRAKDSYESQKVLLRKIKGTISSRAAKFSGYRQQDAHELLSLCLDQLKDDTDGICTVSEESSEGGSKSQESLSPVIRNFECEIVHVITCKGCNMVSRKTEKIYDFALQLPRSVFFSPNEQANLQQLFDIYFTDEDVEYMCTSCKGNSAHLSHQLAQLPRVLILHLKRYGYNSQLSKNSKRVDNIRIPRFINIGHLCSEDFSGPCEFRGPWPRDHRTLSAMASTGDDKENVPSPRLHTTPPPNHRRVAENHNSPSISLPTHSTPDYPTKRTTVDLTMGDGAHTPSRNSSEQPHCVLANGHPQSDSVAAGLQHVGVHTHAHESTHRGDGSQRETVLGKRKSSERNLTSISSPIPLYCEESVDSDHNKRKVRRTDNSSSSVVSSMNPNTGTVEGSVSKSEMIVEEFDSLFASPEIVFDFDQPEAILISEQKPFDQEASRATSCPQNQQSQSSGYQDDPVGIGLMQENEDLQRAMAESLKAQPNDFQMLHQMGLSEEDQLRIAMELSIQESSPDEAPIPSPSYPVDSEAAQTPTPEKCAQAYRLMSIVSHIGRGSSGGHYISDVHSVGEGVWKMYNDSQVTELREEDIRQRRQTSGYIFFYMHKSTLSSVAKHIKR